MRLNLSWQRIRFVVFTLRRRRVTKREARQKLFGVFLPHTCHPEFALATFSPSPRISLCVYAAVALFCSTKTLKKQGSGGGGGISLLLSRNNSATPPPPHLFSRSDGWRWSPASNQHRCLLGWLVPRGGGERRREGGA